MKSLAPNTLLQNRYLVVHLIGKGGMGDVYLAVDQRLGSAVALKRTFFADDEMLGNAFEREAKTLARLRHPVLPKVSDHFIENGEQYLVMEHISGDDLSKRLEAAQKPFPLSWVLFWADQLLDSLAYLHAHEPSIIHRDIKPQNLKLTDENSIILLDFGLSKNNTGESRVMTGSTGSIVGYTPHYAPMEQIRGTGTDPRSDLYSLSATLYQLMTNLVPSDSLTRADALLNDMADPVKPINELNPEVSSAVSSVILKGMEISQERRFPNARDMQKALRDAFANMQNAMTAQTIAFNVQSEQNLPTQSEPVSQPISASQEKTEVLSISPNELPPIAAAGIPVALAADLTNQTAGQTPNFEATVPINSKIEDNDLKQSDVKTEVFIAGSLPVFPAVPGQNLFAKENGQSENPAPTGNFSDNESFGANENKTDSSGFAPEATTPLFNYENQEKAEKSNLQPGDSMFFTNPNIGQNVDSFATYTPTPNTSGNAGQTYEEAGQFNSQPQPQVQPPPPTAQKKSGGKALAIIGGLGALLILTVAAAGGGWYYYNNYYAGGITENPSLSPSVEFSPSPEPGLPIAMDMNTNSNMNSNSSDTNSSNNTNIFDTNTNTQTNSTEITSPVSTPPPAVEQPTAQRTVTPRPTPPPRTPTPLKPNVSTPPKPTPKTTKTPFILQ